jgi:hypothetical protein
MLLWQKKKKITMFDIEIAQSIKDGKLPPNQYFKLPRKDILTSKMQVPDDMYTTKKHKFS